MLRGGAWLRLALVAAAVATARAGGCSGARHALLPLQTANPHKYAHVACVHVVPGREATLHLLVPAANFTGQESYDRGSRPKLTSHKHVKPRRCSCATWWT
jgi:hypothetical protein